MPTNQGEVLEKLTELTRDREGPVSAAAIATELKSSKATVTSLLSKLKARGLVKGSGVEFMPTEAGSTKAGSGSDNGKDSDNDDDNVIVTTTADVGLDEVSKFVYYGQIADMKEKEIECALVIFREGDMLSMAHFDSVMAQAHIPTQPRDKWRNMYLSYLRLGTPVEQRDRLYPLPPTPPEAGPPSATVVAEAAKKEGEEVRDWIVEGFDIHRVGEGLGEFTWKEALQAVAVKRGTGVQPLPQDSSNSLKDLAEALKVLNPDPTQPLTPEGILDLMTRLNEVRRSNGDAQPAPLRYYTDALGNTRQLAPDEPITIHPPAPVAQPGKNYYWNPETKQMEETPNDGRPFIVTINQGGGDGGGKVPLPMFGSNGSQLYDKDGNPATADYGPAMKWMEWQSDQRRKDEMHDAKVGAWKTVQENVGDVVSALKGAAQEIRGGGGPGKTAPEASEGTVYECGDCHQQFKVPAGPFAGIKCPHCGREYTREEVMA